MGDPVELLAKLKEQYGVEEDALYGQCIVVPATKFGVAWREQLLEQGCKVFQGNRGVHAVFYVKLPEDSKEQATEPKVVYEPPQTPEAPEKPAHSFLGKPWTHEEDKEVIKGVTLGQNNELIAERLPGRTPVAVGLRINRLRKHGALPPAQGRGKRRKPLTEAAAAPRKPGRPKKAAAAETLRKVQPEADQQPNVEAGRPSGSAPSSILPFPEMWAAAKQHGQGIDDIAEEFYNRVKDTITEDVLETFLRMFAELEGHVNWLSDNKVDQEQLNKLNILLRQHKHIDNQIYVPLEAQ